MFTFLKHSNKSSVLYETGTDQFLQVLSLVGEVAQGCLAAGWWLQEASLFLLHQSHLKYTAQHVTTWGHHKFLSLPSRWQHNLQGFDRTVLQTLLQVARSFFTDIYVPRCCHNEHGEEPVHKVTIQNNFCFDYWLDWQIFTQSTKISVFSFLFFFSSIITSL